MLMRQEGSSMRGVVRILQRSPSTVGRGLKRHSMPDGVFVALVAGEQARKWRFQCRRDRKLGPDPVLFSVVEYCLRAGWSSQEIAGTLKNRYPYQAAYQGDIDPLGFGDLGHRRHPLFVQQWWPLTRQPQRPGQR